MMRKKNEQKMVDVVYGVHPVLEVLKTKRRKIFEVYALKNESKIWAQVEPLLPKYKIIVHQVGRETLTQKMGTTEHQGIALIVSSFPFRSAFFNPQKEPFLVMLDGIQDVRNRGAIIRSAYCTGAQGVILVGKQDSSLSAACVKASAGLSERMEIYQASSPAQALIALKQAGYSLYVTALGGKKDATSCDYQFPLCVIIGSEEKGVSQESLKAGTVITLPQKTDDISYNASVAAGIVLFLIAHQTRNCKKI